MHSNMRHPMMTLVKLDAGYKDSQPHRQHVPSIQQVIEQFQEGLRSIQDQAAIYRAPPEKPQRAPLDDLDEYLSRESMRLQHAQIADVDALKATLLSRRTVDLQQAATRIASSCNELLAGRQSALHFAKLPGLLQELSLAVSGARMAGQHHHQAVVQLEIVHPSHQNGPIGKVWTREMEKAFRALQGLTQEWQQALNQLLCGCHQLLAFAAVEQAMSQHSTAEQLQDVRQQAEAALLLLRSSISHSHANAYLIASSQGQLSAAFSLLDRCQQQTRQLQIGQQANESVIQLSGAEDHAQAIAAVRAGKTASTYLTLDESCEGLFCSLSSISLNFGTVASGTGQVEQSVIVNNSLSRPLKMDIRSDSSTLPTSIIFETKQLHIPAHGSSYIQCLLDTSKGTGQQTTTMDLCVEQLQCRCEAIATICQAAVQLDEEINWGDLAADPNLKETRHVTVQNKSSFPVLIKCRMQLGEFAGLFKLKSDVLRLEPHSQVSN